MRAKIARKFVGLGARFERSGSPQWAERSYRCALGVSEAESSAWFRLGRLRERAGHGEEAAKFYRRALKLPEGAVTDTQAGGQAAWWLGLGRVLDAAKDWPNADAAYAAALRRDASKPAWCGRRARVNERLDNLAEAATLYAQAQEHEPDNPAWVAGQVRVGSELGALDRCLSVLRQAETAGVESPELAKLRLSVYGRLGLWEDLCDIWAARVLAEPNDSAVRLKWATSLERRAAVPFVIGDDGALTPTDPARAQGLFAQAAEQLQTVIADPAVEARTVHRLGALYERMGEFQNAADTYRLALRKLATVDEYWVHRATEQWRFRLACVEYIGGGAAPEDPNALRRISRDQGAVTVAPLGYFHPQVVDAGLRITGFLGHELASDDANVRIAVYADDIRVKEFTVYSTAWRPSFNVVVAHQVLSTFNKETRITLRADGRSLVTTGGVDSVRLSVPDGTGELADKLAAGATITKWGAWAPQRHNEPTDEHKAVIALYQRVRDHLGSSLDVKPFLFYGTLLGCWRDGRLIPGDEDFDMSFLVEAETVEEFKQRVRDVAFDLLRAGFDVFFTITGRMFKVSSGRTWLDVLPLWLKDGKGYAFRPHDIGREVILPLQTVRLAEAEVYVPHQPDVFLAENYGPGWRVPEPDFGYGGRDTFSSAVTRTWATPSELAEFEARAQAEKARNPRAGEFLGRRTRPDQVLSEDA